MARLRQNPSHVLAGMVPLTEEERAAERERRQDRRAASNGHSELQHSDEEGECVCLDTEPKRAVGFILLAWSIMMSWTHCTLVEEQLCWG